MTLNWLIMIPIPVLLVPLVVVASLKILHYRKHGPVPPEGPSGFPAIVSGQKDNETHTFSLMGWLAMIVLVIASFLNESFGWFSTTSNAQWLGVMWTVCYVLLLVSLPLVVFVMWILYQQELRGVDGLNQIRGFCGILPFLIVTMLSISWGDDAIWKWILMPITYLLFGFSVASNLFKNGSVGLIDFIVGRKRAE